MLKIPSEFDRHRRTWMAWPWTSTWEKLSGTSLKQCQSVFDRLVRVIANYEDVSLLARECDVASLERRFKRRTADRYSIQVVTAKYNDIWVRDTLPTFAIASERLVAISWNFNGWGRRVRPFGSYGDDARLCSIIAKLCNAHEIDSFLTAEGGAFAFDANNFVFTTRSVLLDQQRNPRHTKLELEEKILRVTGRSKVCWLPGDRSEPVTSGHVDSIMAFAKDAVLVNWMDDETNPEFDICDYNARTLKSWLEEQGLHREILKIRRSEQSNKVEHCLSYINFACVNGGLVIPKFGKRAEDDYARAAIEEAFGDKAKAESVDVMPIAVAGGGIHCITQQEPIVKREFNWKHRR